MPVEQTAEITHSAYELAWQEFINFAGLSVDERRAGTNQLRWSALGMTRQYEQITRSKSRVGPSIYSARR